MTDLHRSDKQSWVDTIWGALHNGEYPDDQWDDICTAMAWITEHLNLDMGAIEAEPGPGCRYQPHHQTGTLNHE